MECGDRARSCTIEERSDGVEGVGTVGMEVQDVKAEQTTTGQKRIEGFLEVENSGTCRSSVWFVLVVDPSCWG
jgi:hypothetical protein